jgi:hypothetical protein
MHQPCAHCTAFCLSNTRKTGTDDMQSRTTPHTGCALGARAKD